MGGQQEPLRNQEVKLPSVEGGASTMSALELLQRDRHFFVALFRQYRREKGHRGTGGRGDRIFFHVPHDRQSNWSLAIEGSD